MTGSPLWVARLWSPTSEHLLSLGFSMRYILRKSKWTIFFILKQTIWVENTIKKEENQTSQPKAKSSESVSRSVMSDSLGPPMDYSPPGSSVHEILQVRILEWVAISFSRGSSWSRDQTQGSNLLHCRRILYCLNHEGSPKASSNYLWSDEVRFIYPSQWEMKHRLSCQTKEHRELL